MAKNNNLIYIGGALLIGGAYLAYKKGVFGKKPVTPADIKDEQRAQAEADALKIIADKAKASTTTIANPNSYKANVAVMQKALGITPDGIVGPQTLKAVQAKYPNVTAITPAIVMQITPFIQANGFMPNPSVMQVTATGGNTGIVNPLDLQKY
jgi:hypothetical protein